MLEALKTGGHIHMKVVVNPTCRMCDNKDFLEVINLGEHPLVNSLVSPEELQEKDPVFPLVVKQCTACSLVQLVEVIDAEEIYKKVDYLYFSSDMPGLDKYFRLYADDVVKRFITDPTQLVVEIGSNDGILLKLLGDRARILGIDPATNVVLRALKLHIPTIPLFFSSDLARKIKKEWGAARVVIGNNCIAHLNDLRDLATGVSELLADDGVFIIECNYWGGMVKNTNYSLIYHDHYSFFTLKTWQQFGPRYGLRPFDAVVTPAQGGSLRLFLCKDNRPETERLRHLENNEASDSLNSYSTSVKYGLDVKRVSSRLSNIVNELKRADKRISGYGAAAKGFTILRCSGLGREHIDYFVDDSPAKQGWYTPVDHIPIISRVDAEKCLPDYFIILAPNYADVIIEKESEFRKNGGKFIVPIGNIEIV